MAKNLVVHYLYRDASNYKKHGCVILVNDAGIQPDDLYMEIKLAFSSMNIFSDIVAFDPSAFGWPTLFFNDGSIGNDDVFFHELDYIEGLFEVDTLNVSSEMSASSVMALAVSLRGHS